MPHYRLGVNTCFAVKRWPNPSSWAALVRDELGVDLIQHSLDLVDLDAPEDELRGQATDVASACAAYALELHSTFTGLAAYSSNLMLHPDRDFRDRASGLYRRIIDFTAATGARSTGGHIGAFSVQDWADLPRREFLTGELRHRLRHLAEYAKSRGLESLMVENLASIREPSTIDGVVSLLAQGDHDAVPIVLCLDVGHPCASPASPGSTMERNLRVWAGHIDPFAPVVQLQQSDGIADRHWPFTTTTNATGIIVPGALLDALDASGATDIALILEVIPPFEADDRTVLSDMAESLSYWRLALSERANE